MRRMLLLAATWGAIIASGCATALNMQDATLRKPYGGFTMSPTEFFGGDQYAEVVSYLFWPMWLLDKPLSLCADTVTLPYTLWAQRTNSSPSTDQRTEQGQPPPAPAAQGPTSGR
jgi:uncharacterized protein YceK